MANPLNLANRIANIFNGAKPKTKPAPAPKVAVPGTFQQIGNKMATATPAAKKFQAGFKKSLGGY